MCTFLNNIMYCVAAGSVITGKKCDDVVVTSSFFFFLTTPPGNWRKDLRSVKLKMAKWYILLVISLCNLLLLMNLCSAHKVKVEVTKESAAEGMKHLHLSPELPKVPPYFPEMSEENEAWLGKDSGKCPNFVFEKLFGRKSAFGKKYYAGHGKRQDLTRSNLIYSSSSPSLHEWKEMYIRNGNSAMCINFLNSFLKIDERFRQRFVTVEVPAMDVALDNPDAEPPEGMTPTDACLLIAKSHFGVTKFKRFLRFLSRELAPFGHDMAVAETGNCALAVMQHMAALCFFHRMTTVFQLGICNEIVE